MMRRTKNESGQPNENEDKEKRRGSPRDLLRLLSYTRPYRARLAIALASLLIASLLGLAFPQVVRLLIDAAFVERNSQKLNGLAATLIGLFAVQAAFSFL